MKVRLAMDIKLTNYVRETIEYVLSVSNGYKSDLDKFDYETREYRQAEKSLEYLSGKIDVISDILDLYDLNSSLDLIDLLLNR